MACLGRQEPAANPTSLSSRYPERQSRARTRMSARRQAKPVPLMDNRSRAYDKSHFKSPESNENIVNSSGFEPKTKSCLRLDSFHNLA